MPASNTPSSKYQSEPAKVWRIDLNLAKFIERPPQYCWRAEYFGAYRPVAAFHLHVRLVFGADIRAEGFNRRLFAGSSHPGGAARGDIQTVHGWSGDARQAGGAGEALSRLPDVRAPIDPPASPTSLAPPS